MPGYRDPTLLIFQGARMLILTRRVGETLMIGDEGHRDSFWG